MSQTQAASQFTRRHRLIWAGQGFVVLVLIWLALNGWRDLQFGLLAAAAGALASAWLASSPPHPWRPHRLAAFLAYFLWESFRGGIDVAWRALHPKLLIDPCFGECRLYLPPGQPQTLLISIVSLLPGTLSAAMKDEQTLLVHALTPKALDSISELEGWIAWLFSLPVGASEDSR